MSAFGGKADMVMRTSASEIYDRIKAGVIERGRGRLYAIEDSVRRYCEWLRGKVALDN